MVLAGYASRVKMIKNVAGSSKDSKKVRELMKTIADLKAGQFQDDFGPAAGEEMRGAGGGGGG